MIQDDGHLLVVLRYIEANPLRAGVVKDLSDYPWSSYQAHGLGRPDPLLASFPEWEVLGQIAAMRQSRWRRKLIALQEENELSAVRASLRTGRPFGALAWSESIANRLGLDLKARPRGRPRKSDTSGTK